jgi:hypothetical protein
MVNWKKAREAIKLIFRKNNSLEVQIVRELGKDAMPLEQNIYSASDTKTYAQKWLPIHTTFKYRIVMPGLMLLDAFFEHYKVKELPLEEQHWTLHVFDQAFKNTEREWYKYVLHDSQKDRDEPPVIDEGVRTCEPITRLRSMKEWYLTGLLYDNMYKEFHTMLMFNIWAEMSKATEGKELNHLIYRQAHIDDVRYFSLFSKMRNWKMFKEHTRTEGSACGVNRSFKYKDSTTMEEQKNDEMGG